MKITDKSFLLIICMWTLDLPCHWLIPHSNRWSIIPDILLLQHRWKTIYYLHHCTVPILPSLANTFKIKVDVVHSPTDWSFSVVMIQYTICQYTINPTAKVKKVSFFLFLHCIINKIFHAFHADWSFSAVMIQYTILPHTICWLEWGLVGVQGLDCYE